jgi:hypothetical protein
MMQQPMTVAAPEVVAGPVTFTVDLAVKALGGSTVATFLFGLIGYIVFGSTIGADYSTYFGMLLAGTACGGAGAFVIHKQTAGQQCFGIVFTVLLLLITAFTVLGLLLTTWLQDASISSAMEMLCNLPPAIQELMPDDGPSCSAWHTAEVFYILEIITSVALCITAIVGVMLGCKIKKGASADGVQFAMAPSPPQ